MVLVKRWFFGLAWWSLTLFAMVVGFFFLALGSVLRKIESSLERKSHGHGIQAAKDV